MGTPTYDDRSSVRCETHVTHRLTQPLALYPRRRTPHRHETTRGIVTRSLGVSTCRSREVLVRVDNRSSTDVGRVVRPNDRVQVLIVVMSVNLDLDFLNFVWSVRNQCRVIRLLTC